MGNKDISIPKLGLRHHAMLKDIKDPIQGLRKIIDSIHPGLSTAESDLVALHTLEFNGKIKESSVINGFKYNLSEAYICQRLSFSYGGKDYVFRSHKPFEEFGPVDSVLSSLYQGNEVPDFLDMPAFVAKWADDIINTVAIPGPNGPIKGMLKIMDILK